MPANRQRVIYGVVLAVAVIGLAVDRLFLAESATGPRSADAAIPDATSPTTTGAPASLARAAAATPAGAQPLAARLSNIAAQRRLILTDVPDAFRPNLNWVGSTAAKTGAGVTKAATIELSEFEAFAKGHRLMAVMQNSQGGAAIIGNQTVMVGQTLDGFKLVAITKRSAFLERDGQRLELSLPAPQAPAGD